MKESEVPSTDGPDMPSIVTTEERYNIEHRDSLKEEEPELGDHPVQITLRDVEPLSWIFYWASTTSDNPYHIKGYQESYDKYTNHGFKQSTKKGQVTLTCNRPQPYQVDGKTYPRHLHYVVEDQEDKEWSPVKSVRMISPISRDELESILTNKSAIVIFSLPEEYYEDDHIKGTVNFPRERLDGLSSEIKVKKVRKFLNEQVEDYPDIHKKVKNKSLNLLDVPIVVYCMHDKCNSSGKLAEHLYECGVHNVLDWIPGLQGWRKKVSDQDKDLKAGSKTSISPDEVDPSDEVIYQDLQFEGVEYIVESNTKTGDHTLLNDNYEPIGTPTINKLNNITSVEWIDDAEEDHLQEKQGGSDESGPQGEDEPEPEPQPAGEGEDEPEPAGEGEDEHEPEGEGEDEPELQEDDIDCTKFKTKKGSKCPACCSGHPEKCKWVPKEGCQSKTKKKPSKPSKPSTSSKHEQVDDGDLYTVPKRDLENKHKNDNRSLKQYIKQMHGRDPSSYNYKDQMKEKDPTKLKGFIDICQRGAKVSKKYMYWDKDKLATKSVKELQDIVGQLATRDPTEFKSSVNPQTKSELIKYITTCRGSSKKHRTKRKPKRSWGYDI